MNTVKHDVAISGVGSAGIFGAVTLSQFNAALGTIIAGLSILGLIPLVWTRWKKFLGQGNSTTPLPPDDDET